MLPKFFNIWKYRNNLFYAWWVIITKAHPKWLTIYSCSTNNRTCGHHNPDGTWYPPSRVTLCPAGPTSYLPRRPPTLPRGLATWIYEWNPPWGLGHFFVSIMKILVCILYITSPPRQHLTNWAKLYYSYYYSNPSPPTPTLSPAWCFLLIAKKEKQKRRW